MGLLDEAIREHLELKRRRGADPTEVDRLEREALGPVRRSPQPAEEPFLDEEPAEHQGAQPVLYDDQAAEAFAVPVDEAYAEPPELADEPAFAEEPRHEQFPEDESEEGWPHEPAETWDQPRHEQFPEDESEEGWSHEPAGTLGVEEPLAPEHPSAPADEAPASAEPAARTPPPAPAEPLREPSDHPGEETVEYDVEAEEIKGGRQQDDVLEETPEFLQDTPDHDRLWFEQRPPRDFDFDK